MIQKMAHVQPRARSRAGRPRQGRRRPRRSSRSPRTSRQCTKADFLSKVGKRPTPFLRFSTVAGEHGTADTERDPRGFAIKFYTDEGNYDLVGNNTPVFFIRDP